MAKKTPQEYQASCQCNKGDGRYINIGKYSKDKIY